MKCYNLLSTLPLCYMDLLTKTIFFSLHVDRGEIISQVTSEGCNSYSIIILKKYLLLMA